MKNILIKLEQLEQIKKIIPKFLPKMLANNCIVANIRDGILTLVTNSPVWKHQLNFLKMDLLEQFRKSCPLLAGLSSIEIKIDYLQEDLQKYNHNISEYYKCFGSSDYNNYEKTNLNQNNYNYNHINNNINIINNKNNFKQFNAISISKTTSNMIENIISQEINYQPLLDAFKNLLHKITR